MGHDMVFISFRILLEIQLLLKGIETLYDSKLVLLNIHVNMKGPNKSIQTQTSVSV